MKSLEKVKAMKGSQKIIDALNDGLTIELTAINLYFISSKMCKDWGFEKLAKHFYDESIEEMKHADQIIDRILYLDGVPEIARYDVIQVGKTVEEQIQNSLTLETKGVSTYNGAIELCHQEKDAGSRELMDQMVVESEDSIDWCEAQLELIKQVGIQNYLAEQIRV
tara:strand:- start:141472 stop:141969 length:498 start_codon:yes stop_codon:yes gene_type:complete